jgi:site-specific recombinase XerC
VQQREANPDRAIHQVAWLRNHFKPAVRRVLPDRADYSNKRGLRFHDLRHSYASFLIARGAHLEAVRTLLGHASIVTTQRYAHLAPDVYDALAASLGGEPAAPAAVAELRAVE